MPTTDNGAPNLNTHITLQYHVYKKHLKNTHLSTQHLQKVKYHPYFTDLGKAREQAFARSEINRN